MAKKKVTSKKTTPEKETRPVKAARKSSKGANSTARKASAKVEKTQSVEQKTPETKAASPAVTANMRNPRLWVGLAIVILVILVVAFKGLFIAAMVNGQPISRLSVIQELEKQDGKTAMSSLVTQSLIMQEAQKRHVTVSQSEVNSDLDNIDKALKSQGQSLDSALAARGLSKQDLIQQITLQKLVEKMVGNQVKVSDADVQKYIDDNQANLPQDLSADQLKAQVRQQLEQQQLQDKTQTFVSNLEKQAKISYFVNY